ncbi:unnamed protein product [Dicrocoelium dendriticum]|nr:unnamed protein product [Dicrocoelium dendriticum]
MPCLLKAPLVCKLKWRNPILPFEDASFIEKMCQKYDCSLFVVGLHSKKRPHNIILGRLHDGEILDMFELGIQSYQSLPKYGPGITGAKPMLLFSGTLFDEDRKFVALKSLLIDLFKGPNVEGIRSLGVEHMIHFAMVSDTSLAMRVRHLSFCSNDKRLTDVAAPDEVVPPLFTPWGASLKLQLDDSGPSVDFEIRRVTLPSEEKWKRAHRLPPETMLSKKTPRNQETDVFGSRIGRVHVGKSDKMETIRPGASLRTALTGNRKRGFDRHKSTKSQYVDSPANKRRKLSGSD